LPHGFLGRQEVQVLQAKFSSGVRLRDLRSIALVICTLAKIEPPGRDAKRQLGLMLAWFRGNWEVVSSWLPFVHLCDDGGRPIDGQREFVEISLKRLSP
jgi:hypothetical protein